MVRIFFFVCYIFVQLGKVTLPIAMGTAAVVLQWGFRLAIQFKYGPNETDNIGELANHVGNIVIGQVDLSAIFPPQYWHRLLFLAQSASVFSAFVLYYHFPARYEYLKLSPAVNAILHFVIPTLQALFIAFALVEIHNTYLHAFATTCYLMLFIVWDLVIIFADVKLPNCSSGKEFQARVKDYLIVDLAYFFICAIFFWMTAGNSGYESFAAGVLGTQAALAFLTAARMFLSDHVRPTWQEIRVRYSGDFSGASNVGGLQ